MGARKTVVIGEDANVPVATNGSRRPEVLTVSSINSRPGGKAVSGTGRKSRRKEHDPLGRDLPRGKARR